jgi:hypothetical protein
VTNLDTSVAHPEMPDMLVTHRFPRAGAAHAFEVVGWAGGAIAIRVVVETGS